MMLKKKSFRKYFYSRSSHGSNNSSANDLNRAQEEERARESREKGISPVKINTSFLPRLPSLPLYETSSSTLPALPLERNKNELDTPLKTRNALEMDRESDQYGERDLSSTLSSSLSPTQRERERFTERTILERESVPWRTVRAVMDTLSLWQCDSHIDAVLYAIYGPLTHNARIQRGITHWTASQVSHWLRTLSFLGAESERLSLCACVVRDGVDGEVFTALLHGTQDVLSSHNAWFASWPCMQRTMNRCVLSLILFVWTHPREKEILHFDEHVFRGVPLAVQAGFVDDLTVLSPERAAEVLYANAQCVRSGEGGVYGQLVVLGHAEYRPVHQANQNTPKWLPVGLANERFVLVRRKNANGLMEVRRFLSHSSHALPTDHTQGGSHFARFQFSSPEPHSATSPLSHNAWDEVVVEYARCPDRDVFQLGRAASSANDWSVRGAVHAGTDGVPSGPLSRFACRIECERVAPFRVFIFAGGFDEEKVLRANGVEHADGTHDGFTSFGVRVFDPEVGDWVEVSVCGHTHTQRAFLSHSLVPEAVRPTLHGNQLSQGCIVDVCGVLMVFQDPLTMARAKQVNPQRVIDELNALRPQCPVLFSHIAFSFSDAHTRLRNAHTRTHFSADARQSALCCGPIHVPPTDYAHIESERRTYVYPACGHVHGYHSSLCGRVCPLCRKAGPFVPIAFAFDSVLCEENTETQSPPTHVFNPCGHVASERVVKQWSALRIFDDAHNPLSGAYAQRGTQPPSRTRCAMCPFCSTSLDRDTPYSKLLLHTETHNDLHSLPSHSHSRSHKSLQPVREEDESESEWLARVRAGGWTSRAFQRALAQSQAAVCRDALRSTHSQWVFPTYAPHVFST